MINTLLQNLKRERIILEGEFAGRRSLLDRLIHQIETALNGTPVATGTQMAAITTPPPVAPLVASARSKPHPKRIRAAERNGASSARAWIAKHEQFKVSDLAMETGGSHSATSCAVLKMAKAGEIERVGFGRYRRTPAFRPPEPSVAAQYSEFRKTITTAPNEE